MHKKIIPILIVLLIITSVAFGQELIPKVFINNQEIKYTVVDGEVYIPVSALKDLEIYIDTSYLEDKGIFKIDLAKKSMSDAQMIELIERIYDLSIKRIETPIEYKDKNDLLDKTRERLSLILKDITELETIQTTDVDILVLKNCLHSFLNQELTANLIITTMTEKNDKINQEKFDLLKKHQPDVLRLMDITYKVWLKCAKSRL